MRDDRPHHRLVDDRRYVDPIRIREFRERGRLKGRELLEHVVESAREPPKIGGSLRSGHERVYVTGDVMLFAEQQRGFGVWRKIHRHKDEFMLLCLAHGYSQSMKRRRTNPTSEISVTE